jgi:hypothetical protein
VDLVRDPDASGPLARSTIQVANATFPHQRLLMFHAKIKELLFNHHDDLDGWELQDGTMVHFPPHVGEQLGEWIGEGDEVYLEGETRTNRHGVEVLFPTYVESQGWSLTLEQSKPKPHKKHDDRHPHEPKSSHVSNEQIMRELRAIRSLIEAWSER